MSCYQSKPFRLHAIPLMPVYPNAAWCDRLRNVLQRKPNATSDEAGDVALAYNDRITLRYIEKYWHAHKYSEPSVGHSVTIFIRLIPRIGLWLWIIPSSQRVRCCVAHYQRRLKWHNWSAAQVRNVVVVFRILLCPMICSSGTLRVGALLSTLQPWRLSP